MCIMKIKPHFIFIQTRFSWATFHRQHSNVLHKSYFCEIYIYSILWRLMWYALILVHKSSALLIKHVLWDLGLKHTPIPPSHTHSIMWRRRRRRFWHSPRSRLNWTSWSSNGSQSNGSPVAGGSGLPSPSPSPPMSLLTFRWTLTSGGGLWPLK